jgi:1-acyl-sn-glycerol-3-phosphate acyltransferase
MLVLRSLLFNIAFYVNLVLWLIILIPFAVLPRLWLMRAVQAWARTCLWLLRVLVGTGVEFRGLQHIPAGGLLVASKHQSLWETFALLTIFDDPCFVLKRELMWIPFFGWYAWKADQVPINRRGGSRALSEMNLRARDEARRGRQILIFPEGTRRPAGAPPAYKFGIAHLYESLDMPCLPIAMNSGLYWPRRRFIRHPGTIRVEILPPIAPGLPKDMFFAELQAQIEAASDRLLRIGQAELGVPAQPRPATTLPTS